MSTPLGQAYTHAGRIVQLLPNLPFISCSEIEWDASTVRGYNFGTGQGAVSHGNGNDEEVPVTLKISMLDFVTLKASSLNLVNPKGNVLRLDPFNILVTDSHPNAPHATRIVGFLLQGHRTSSAVGEKDIKVELRGVARAIE